MDNDIFKIYSSLEKKNIVRKIEQIKNKKHYIEIFKIIKMDNIKYTQNKNGLFIDMNKLSNHTIYKIEEYLKNIEYELSESENSISIDSLSFNNTDDDLRSIMSASKLTNHEKNILKKIKENNL